MTEPKPNDPTRDPFATPAQLRQSRLDRRRQKIRDEIERNRRGEFKVPTWVLTACLLAIIAAIAALIIFVD